MQDLILAINYYITTIFEIVNSKIALKLNVKITAKDKIFRVFLKLDNKAS